MVALALSRSGSEVVMAVASVLTSLVAAFGLCILAVMRRHERRRPGASARDER
jgi:hypothetical protein